MVGESLAPRSTYVYTHAHAPRTLCNKAITSRVCAGLTATALPRDAHGCRRQGFLSTRRVPSSAGRACVSYTHGRWCTRSRCYKRRARDVHTTVPWKNYGANCLEEPRIRCIARDGHADVDAAIVAHRSSKNSMHSIPAHPRLLLLFPRITRNLERERNREKDWQHMCLAPSVRSNPCLRSCSAPRAVDQYTPVCRCACHSCVSLFHAPFNPSATEAFPIPVKNKISLIFRQNDNIVEEHLAMKFY